MIIKINPKEISLAMNITNIGRLCCMPYPNHPKGCPNFKKKQGCPPGLNLLDKIIDFDKDIYLIYTDFNINKHAKRMEKLHPGWSERQIYCCLYWQPMARKLHKEEIEKYKKEKNLDCILTSPEAYGVNVDLLMKQIGINLEWPPRKITRVVSLAGVQKCP